MKSHDVWSLPSEFILKPECMLQVTPSQFSEGYHADFLLLCGNQQNIHSTFSLKYSTRKSFAEKPIVAFTKSTVS